MATPGRPRKQIDQKEFESLLYIQCTLSEVTAYFDNKLNGCSEDTIERWCKRTYKKRFAEVSAEKREVGKISLRRMQWRLAEKNAAMAIFLGKQYLGQKDQQEQKIEITKGIDATADRIQSILDGMDKDQGQEEEAKDGREAD